MSVISVYHLLWICICALGALVLRMCYQHWRTTKALEQRIRDNLASRAPAPPVPIRPPPPALPSPPPPANLFGTSAEDAPEAAPLEQVLARAQRAAEARVAPVSEVPPPRMASLRVPAPVAPPVVAPEPAPAPRVAAPHVPETPPEPPPAAPPVVQADPEPAREPTAAMPLVEPPPLSSTILTDLDLSSQPDAAPLELLPEPRGPVNWPSFPPPVEVEGEAPEVPEAPALPPLPQDPIERLEALARARSSGRAVLREPVRGIRSNPLVVSTPIEHDEEPAFEPQPAAAAPTAPEPAPPAAAPRPPARTLAAFYSAYESVTPPAKREDPAEVLRRALAQAHAEAPPAEARPPAKKLSFRKSPPK